MKVQIHKFGGASVQDAAAIRNVAEIIQALPQGKKVIVVSAMGKTTNDFEKVMSTGVEDTKLAIAELASIRDVHFAVARELLGNNAETLLSNLNDLFVDVEWQLDDIATNELSYSYDQIVSIGELASSRILAAYLDHLGSSASWFDVRDAIRTDDDYRQAKVDWQVTESQVKSQMLPMFDSADLMITQGFIGSTDYNDTTTLGREGSDYTAAIMAYCLDAEQVSIWKDVPGVLSADPKLFSDASFIPEMSYREAVEMTYYGAKVIHPKTIKPLENKGIPMVVRSFKKPDQMGTTIASYQREIIYPPVIVVAERQSFLNIKTKDFSFVAVEHLKLIFGIFDEFGIKINMMSNTALSFQCCVRDHVSNQLALIAKLSEDFDVVENKDVSLVTIRHYDEATVEKMKSDKEVLFEQELKDTFQMVVQIDKNSANG